MVSARSSSRAAFLDALGVRLRESREALGLSPEALVKELGYLNPGRGLEKLAGWEQGLSPPRGDRIDALCRVLRFPGSEAGILHALLDDEARAAARGLRPELYNEWLQKLDEEGLLAEQLERFEARSSAILADPELASVRVGGASVALAYCGGGHLSLGRLLTVWSRGLGGFTCPCCGGHFHATRLAGSPLSGSHDLRGFCRANRRIRSAVLPPGQRIGRLAAMTWKAAKLVPRVPSSWSLKQLGDGGSARFEALSTDRSRGRGRA